MVTYALIICCAALWLWCWSLTRSVQRITADLREIKRRLGNETRCRICADREACPAYETGVTYPCAHYKEEN